MAGGGIPDRVVRLVGEHIHSVEQLEVLLLLRRAPEREWTASDVAVELATVPQSAADRLEDLAHRGFLAKAAERYRYDGSDHGRDAAVGELEDAYARRRVTVIGLIFAKPSESIRTFADAFRIRKEE
jgi:hypothetical protein